MPADDTPGRGSLRLFGLYSGALGLALALAFHLGFRLSVTGGVISLFAVALLGFAAISGGTLSLLPRLLLLLYVLPFTVTLPYLTSNTWEWWATPLSRQFMTTPGVMEILLTLGTVGAIGFCSGATLIRWRSGALRVTARPGAPTLPFAVAAAGVLGALLLSAISAPAETVFTARYSVDQSPAAAAAINFNAAGLLAYMTLVLLWIDAGRDDVPWRSGAKAAVVTAASAYIIVVLQLLRGDRDSLGLAVALVALALTRPGFHLSAARRRALLLTGPAALALLVFLAIGPLRSKLSGEDRIDLKAELEETLIQNTWTAVLLNNLGSAAAYHRDEFEYLYGRTYLDFFLSLPPGPVTQFLGVERPLESTRGPSYWFRPLTNGGMHPVVVPFHNFGAFGVFLVLGVVGAVATWLDAMQPRGFWWRLIWAALVCSSFLWFWYGDMSMIRGLMAAAGLGILYTVFLRIYAWWNANRRAIVDAASSRHVHSRV